MTSSEQKQHVDIHRKLKLRRDLIERAGHLRGAVYVPFIGEGDIAVELYTGKKIFGADINQDMVDKAQSRLPDATIIKADCDLFPFNKKTATFAVADLDAYSYPYDSFRAFWKGARIGSHCAVIFTDGQKQAINRTGHYRSPDGAKHHLTKSAERRAVYHFYFNRTLVPWFTEYIKPYKILYITKNNRGPNQLYWGAVISKTGKPAPNNKTAAPGNAPGPAANTEAPDAIKPYKFDDIKKAEYLEHIASGHTRGHAATLVGISRATVCDHAKADKDFAEAISCAEGDATGKVQNALHEAATSGNVTAIQVWLYNRDPKRWSDKRNIQLAGEGGGPIKVEHDARGQLLAELARHAARVGAGEGTGPAE